MIALSQWFFSSSVLILVILVLRTVFAKRLSLLLRYALWGVVLVRLLFPFSPLTSDLSLSAISQPIQEQAESKMLYAIPTQTYYGDYSIGDTPEFNRREVSFHWNGLDAESPNFQVEFQSGGSVKYNDYITHYLFMMPANELISAIWKLGILAVSLWMLCSNVSFSRSLKRNRVPFSRKNSPIPVYLVSEGLPTPCLFGLFAPAVYLTPEASADETTLRHVLAHELTHYAHKDHIWSFLRCICLALHWYNPLVWAAAILSKRDGELACDEGAVKRLGEGERLSYGRTLLGMVARRSTRPADLLTSSTSMAEGKKPIQQRIQLLVKRPETKGAALFLAVCAIALSLVLVFSSQGHPRLLEYTSYDQFLSQFDFTRKWLFLGSDNWNPNDDIPSATHAELERLLAQGTASNVWVSRSEYAQSTDTVSFSCIPTELKLYEMEDGCHLVVSIYFEGDDPDSYLHYHQIQNQYYHLATLPSGTVQKLRDLITPPTPVPLSQEELAFFNTGDFFDHGDRTNGEGRMNIRNQLLSSFYVDPRDINLYELFYCGSGQSSLYAEQRREIYNAIKASTYSPETGCTIVTRAEMDAVLTQHMGITLEETNKVGLEYMDYLPEYDAYYNFHGDTNYGLMVHFTSGQRIGNTIWLYYQDTFGLLGGASCVLTLYQDGDRYYFRANQPTPEGALDGIKNNLSVHLTAQSTTTPILQTPQNGVEFLLTCFCPDLGYSTKQMELFASITFPEEVSTLLGSSGTGTANFFFRLNDRKDFHHPDSYTIYRSNLTEEDVNAILTTKEPFTVTVTFPDGSKQEYNVPLEQTETSADTPS